MLQDVPNPHDAFFKAVFGDLDRSRQFFHTYLPVELTNELDLQQLHLEKASFVDESLRQRHADLLFRSRLKSGKDAWIYLLFEHQSTPESDMPFRLLRYIVRIMEQHRQQHEQGHPYPFIVPVVLYHGTASWSVPLRFSEALEVQKDMGIRPLEMEYLLIDLSRFPDQVLMEKLELELALSLLRHIRDENFLAHFQKILPLLLELRFRRTGLEYIETILRYIYYAREKAEWSDLIEIMHHSDRTIEEVAMTTIAEHLMEKGMVSEAHHVLLEDLEDQFGSVPSTLTEKLQTIQDLTLLRKLRRERKQCSSLDAFEHLIETSLQ